jgi:hypothetical protein
MKALRNRPVTILVIAVSMVILAISDILRVPSSEGFNPSDDGVILAQSYRLINGEIPHRDFISIRPAGSAAMNVIHFFSPLPLEISARWMVLVEYLVYSIFITLLLIGSWFRGLRKSNYLVLVAGSILVMFVLNQNYYNLFPWTTIDGLFWFSISLFGWYKIKVDTTGRSSGWKILLFFAVACAALCRQTFALPGGLLVIRMVVWEIRQNKETWRHNLRRLLPLLVIGFLPGWVYFGMLIFTGSCNDFIQQMTGRTEIWGTGVVRFFQSFWRSPILILFGVAVASGLVKTWNRESGRDTRRIDLTIMLQKFVSLLAKTFLMFYVFLATDRLFAISFAFFWLLVLDIFLIYLHDGRLPRWIRPVAWILLASWTSAISLGDNAPVFALGWLAGTAILLQIKDFWNRIYRNVRPYETIAAGIFIPALVILSMVVQPKVNYRDLPSRQLTRDGGDFFDALSGIRISPQMADYLSEIRKIYEEAGQPRNRFAVWPNNALIYPALGSRNPFPLDWMQSAEYVGNEKHLMESVREKLKSGDLVILVEKMNVKWIASGSIAVDGKSPDYSYLPLLDSFARPVERESRWFKVYRTK